MTKEQFELIEKSWTDILNAAKEKYDNVLSTEDLENLSIKSLKELIEYSKTFQSQMDSLFCNYRHIVGMSKIKPTDRSKLTSILKAVELYRSDAKRIASIKDLNIVKLIPARSTYTLKLTPLITLTSDLRPGQKEVEAEIIENEIIENNNISREVDKDTNCYSPTPNIILLNDVDPVFVSQNVIHFSLNRTIELYKLLAKVGLEPSVQKLINAIEKNGTYKSAGVQYKVIDTGLVKCIGNSPTAQSKICKLYNKEVGLK